MKHYEFRLLIQIADEDTRTPEDLRALILNSLFASALADTIHWNEVYTNVEEVPEP
jgi:hypothetical protein